MKRNGVWGESPQIVSHPARGARIETADPILWPREELESHPARGARIETSASDQM